MSKNSIIDNQVELESEKEARRKSYFLSTSNAPVLDSWGNIVEPWDVLGIDVIEWHRLRILTNNATINRRIRTTKK